MNFNTGADDLEKDHVSLDPAEEAGHWFLLDVAMGRELGYALIGRPPAEVFAAPRKEWVLDALLESLSWYRRDELAGAGSVLNACRAWRFVAEGKWGSKREGMMWAVRQRETPEVVSRAEEARMGKVSLDEGEALRFLELVEGRVRVVVEDLC